MALMIEFDGDALLLHTPKMEVAPKCGGVHKGKRLLEEVYVGMDVSNSSVIAAVGGPQVVY
jgi:hypothetical protein